MKTINDFICRSKEDYDRIYSESVKNPEKFWSDIAETFHWRKKWDQVLEWDFETPEVKWFLNGKLNITENCLDRHLEARGDQTAIIWEPNEPGDEAQHITYKELHARVSQFANALKNMGVEKGDRVCIYLPMVPELAVSVLACARIGAIHSVVFAGFSSTALASRINDASCKVVITSDGSYRGNKTIDLKGITDKALKECACVTNVIVLKRIEAEISMQEGRDTWWHDAIASVSTECPAEEMDSEDSLFILYTSGSTGKPKGIQHSTAGYMVYSTYTFKNVFQYNEGDVYWV